MIKTMKNKLQLLFLASLCAISINAQTEQKSWSLGFGISAIDVYPVGEDLPQGDYFDEFFNLNDHWNTGFYIDLNKHFTPNLSLQLRGSYSELTKWGETSVNKSLPVANLDYIGVDGMINYSLFNDCLISPFIGVGGGYTWIEEGMYNTSTLNGEDNLIGAGTVNAALGLHFNIAKNVAIKVQSTYKHSFEDYLTKHFQHNVGITFGLGNRNEAPKELPDTDGDGVDDEHDLCPDTAGKVEFSGCPDTDEDGVPDSLDACPNEKGADNGCPLKTEDNTQELADAQAALAAANANVTNEIVSAIYFDYNSAQLNKNAEGILDLIYKESKNRNEINIVVDGFADNVGSSSFNKELSDKRVQSVLNYLTSKGISSDKFTTNSYGEDNPAASNDTKSGRALNRRTHLKVTLK